MESQGRGVSEGPRTNPTPTDTFAVGVGLFSRREMQSHWPIPRKGRVVPHQGDSLVTKRRWLAEDDGRPCHLGVFVYELHPHLHDTLIAITSLLII